MSPAIVIGAALLLLYATLFIIAKVHSARNLQRIRRERLAAAALHRRLGITLPDQIPTWAQLRAGRVLVGTCRVISVGAPGHGGFTCTVACRCCRYQVVGVPPPGAWHIADVHTAECLKRR